jgi:hypothetical protein
MTDPTELESITEDELYRATVGPPPRWCAWIAWSVMLMCLLGGIGAWIVYLAKFGAVVLP